MQQAAVPRLGSLLMLALLPACAGYSHLSAQIKVGGVPVPWHFAWDVPETSTDETGLGGGITFAIDPQMCDRLLLRFREQSQSTLAAVLNLGIKFVDCGEIYDALKRAFDTWSANQKLLSFKDVTLPCTRAGHQYAADCTHAEVAIDALPPYSCAVAPTVPRQSNCDPTDPTTCPTETNLCNFDTNKVAFVLNREGRDASFTTRPPGRRTTAGVIVPGDQTIGYSTMVFNTAQCW